MNDLISRQAAIDVLNKYFARIGKLKRRGLNKGEKAISLDVVEAIETLPSAQPENEERASESTQNVPNDDFISRKAAIDAFGLSEKTRKYGGDHSGYDTLMLYEIQNTLEDIPSAEPEVRTQMSSADCISRQAAIDALAEEFYHNEEDYRTAVAVIGGLPSVEPERKKGHWVEIGDEPYDEWECDVCGFVIDGSGCVDPEEYRDVYRFCPRCGSDMRGKEK